LGSESNILPTSVYISGALKPVDHLTLFEDLLLNNKTLPYVNAPVLRNLQVSNGKS
jgi:hypothetical protein